MKQQRNFRNEHKLTTLVDPRQPLQRPSKSQLPLTKLLGKSQFQIKVWHSNSQEVEQASGERHTDFLGHRWDKQEDTFALKKDSVILNEVFTKRSCLPLVDQLWGPTGLVAPAMLKF